MSFAEELLKELEMLNVIADTTVLEKCEELCKMYSLHPDDFMDQWLAYSASKNIPINPTLDALDKLERYELKKLKLTSRISYVPKSPFPEDCPVPEDRPQDQPHVVKPVVNSYVPSESFINRKDSGEVVFKFGETDNSFQVKTKKALDIIFNFQHGRSYHYMHEKVLVKRRCLNAMSTFILKDIRDHHNLELSDEKLKQYFGEMTICGRIVNTCYGKMDEYSLGLEGLVQLYRGKSVILNTRNVEKMRLFPGQSVIATGNNMKEGLLVKEFYTEAPMSQSPQPNFKENIHIMVAAGPFTVQENLLYEPLEELIKHVIVFKPNILILMGPFMEKDHPHLEDLCEDYTDFFENIIIGIMKRVHSLNTQIILVSSHRDIHGHVIFPTLPYKLRGKYENIHLVPSPFKVEIDGLILTGSTADIIFHLSQNEVSKGAYTDRIRQLVKHVFNQRSFYPLHPPPRGVGVDYQLVEKLARIEKVPHLMILPSNLKHFVKVVEDCVVINPERLAKGNGGTFAKIEIRAEPHEAKINERISCEICRV